MIGHRHGWLGWMACLALAMWLGAAAPAAGAQDVVTGRGLIVEKDLDRGLLKLHTGVVLEVTPVTKIASANGKRITIGDLAVAKTDGGAVHADGEAMIRYQGTAHSARISAYSIQVMGTIPR